MKEISAKKELKASLFALVIIMKVIHRFFLQKNGSGKFQKYQKTIVTDYTFFYKQLRLQME